MRLARFRTVHHRSHQESRSAFAARAALWSVALFTASAFVGCSKGPGRGGHPLEREEEIELGQNVTNPKIALDKELVDFEKNWRKFVSPLPELAIPVARPERTSPPRWEPLVNAECVHSADANGIVPQVTLTWLDPIAGEIQVEPHEGPREAPRNPDPHNPDPHNPDPHNPDRHNPDRQGATEGAEGPNIAAQKGGLEKSAAIDEGTSALAPEQVAKLRASEQPITADPGLRFDLAIHHEGFAKSYYSSALVEGQPKRFMLPSNSALVQSPEAVLLTGPGLFPKLMSFRLERVVNPDTKVELGKTTLVLRDLSPGLTYTISLDHKANGWREDRRFSFLSPVCPNDF